MPEQSTVKLDSPYIGLDFETSGLDPFRGIHVPLTLGIAWEVDGAIETDSFNFSIPGHFDINAHRVNKLSYPRPFRNIEDLEYYAQTGDRHLCFFFERLFQGAGEEKLIPVGFNVGPFDMAFMGVFFPQASKYFSHRPFELNTYCHAIDIVLDRNSETDVSTKDQGKDIVESLAQNMDIFSRQAKWHDARFDAWAALIIKRWIDKDLESVCATLYDYKETDMTLIEETE